MGRRRRDRRVDRVRFRRATGRHARARSQRDRARGRPSHARLSLARPAAGDRRAARHSRACRRRRRRRRAALAAQRLARRLARQRRDRSGRRMGADVSRGMAHAARAVLDPGDVGRRLGPRARALRRAIAQDPRAVGTLRPHLGDAGRTGHVARLRVRRRLSARAALPARFPRRRSRVGCGPQRVRRHASAARRFVEPRRRLAAGRTGARHPRR